MQLQCPALLENNEVPTRYTCDGDNISPPLTWSDPPNGTRTFALIVEDPDAPDTVFTHWLVYDMPVERQQLPEGVDGHPELPGGGTQGQNDFGKTGFGGPCPPQGMHRYVFRLFALDQTLEMAPGASKADLLNLMAGHVLETAEITSVYTRQGG
jgi:Raf kinase inhibitor-like YbhB/YbcL family protein